MYLSFIKLLRSIALIPQKENESINKFIIDKLINPEVNRIKQGFSVNDEIVNVQRSMFDRS